MFRGACARVIRTYIEDLYGINDKNREVALDNLLSNSDEKKYDFLNGLMHDVSNVTRVS